MWRQVRRGTDTNGNDTFRMLSVTLNRCGDLAVLRPSGEFAGSRAAEALLDTLTFVEADIDLVLDLTDLTSLGAEAGRLVHDLVSARRGAVTTAILTTDERVRTELRRQGIHDVARSSVE